MADLRSLIKYADDSTFRSVVGLTTNYGSAYRQIRLFEMCTGGGGILPYSSSINWRAPQGTNFIKIEIWGGGGAGANTCCCMFGFPGGSGAYAYRTLCSRDLGDLGGCPFEFCIGQGGCCTATGVAPTVGFFGCKTYATGVGLCNFCAEGGQGGMAFCALSHNCCFCYSTEGQNPMHGGTMDFRGTNEICGPHVANCGFHCFSTGGGIGQFHQLNNMGKNRSNAYACMFEGKASRFDSCNQAIQLGHAVNHCYGGLCFGILHCAPYYGADGGAFGLPGALGSPCNQDAGQWCMVKQYIPYPGGLINTRGGYWARRYDDMNYAGENSYGTWMNISMGLWAGSSDGNWGIPGAGGNTASSTGGPCYCGGPGYNGMVQITYGGTGQGYT